MQSKTNSQRKPLMPFFLLQVFAQSHFKIPKYKYKAKHKQDNTLKIKR